MPSSTSPKSSFATARQKEREQPKIRGKNARRLNERDQAILEAVKVLHNTSPPSYSNILQLFEQMHVDKVVFIEYWPHLKARLDANMASTCEDTRGRGTMWLLAMALAKRYRYAPMVSQLMKIYTKRPGDERKFRYELKILTDLETHD
jgi:hypothetical protein